MAGRRIAGVVLVGNAEIAVAERHPDPLAAPADVNGLADERHRLAERGDGFRRQLVFEAGLESEVADMNEELAHQGNLVNSRGGGITGPDCSGPAKKQGR